MSTATDLLAVTTGTTCGMACWEAREDACHCSCGGRNHGIMRQQGAERPERTRRIQGRWYRLESIGTWGQINEAEYEINYGPMGRPLRRLKAVAQTATASQRNWPEVQAWVSAQDKPDRLARLLWLPVEESVP